MRKTLHPLLTKKYGYWSLIIVWPNKLQANQQVTQKNDSQTIYEESNMSLLTVPTQSDEENVNTQHPPSWRWTL